MDKNKFFKSLITGLLWGVLSIVMSMTISLRGRPLKTFEDFLSLDNWLVPSIIVIYMTIWTYFKS